ncbi:aspartate/ornithine carbamoyltransferase family protein [Prosthecomicrobium sp. N25]|uniref:aspartate/ornithine carbamoyltransferase family protein n=1 Tax=Prosthecomicrobium sp. N25 TaxID=3129254 RepID=UPI003076C985
MAYMYSGSGTALPRSETRRGPRHLLTASTLDGDDIDDYCQLAEAFEARKVPTGRSAGLAIALLFFQPSTRTRIGFEVATVALGSHAIGIEDMSASRSNKRTGESLEDCAAVFAALCDAIVVRHHEAGAAARMAARSSVPVINAGDGWNEHPSQALIDIYALRRGLGRIRGTSIAIGGDPRGRTVRSLCQLLRYEAPGEVLFCPPPHIPVPDDVLDALARHQVRCRIITDIATALKSSDAIMMAPYDMSDIGEAAASDYVSPRLTPDSHVITPEKIARLGSRALLYHPLPRQDEIHPACDNLDNARYFEQVRLSKFMRMAILDRALSRD